jgi:hypothetical protein
MIDIERMLLTVAALALIAGEEALMRIRADLNIDELGPAKRGWLEQQAAAIERNLAILREMGVTTINRET